MVLFEFSSQRTRYKYWLLGIHLFFNLEFSEFNSSMRCVSCGAAEEQISAQARIELIIASSGDSIKGNNQKTIIHEGFVVSKSLLNLTDLYPL